MLLSGADGRENHVVWVLKQEINVSMLYPMNWKLLNLCMKLQPNVSGGKSKKKKKKNGCNSGKDFSKYRLFGWIVWKTFWLLVQTCMLDISPVYANLLWPFHRLAGLKSFVSHVKEAGCSLFSPCCPEIQKSVMTDGSSYCTSIYENILIPALQNFQSTSVSIRTT